MTPEELAERIHPSMSVERRHAESDLEAVRRRTAGIILDAIDSLLDEIAELEDRLEIRTERMELAESQAKERVQSEMAGLRKRIAELTAENAGLRAAITRGGFDIAPCLECGKAVVCVPDGLACCGDCAAQLADAANLEAEENRR